jgi:HK97 family phage prohead protease
MKIEMVDPEPAPEPAPTAEPEPGPAIELTEVRRKSYVAETKTLKNGDIEAYVSTEAVDRMGDIIRTKGWELDNFRKTGAPVLWGHNHHLPPIGKAVEIEAQRKGLWAVTRFHEKTAQSRELAVLARERIIPSWSVGFNPLEAPEPRTVEGEMKGFIFKRQELLEYSLVSIPANQEAVSKALFLARKGSISREMAALIAGPSPMAEQDGGPHAKEQIAESFKLSAESQDAHLAKLAGLYFLKKVI